MATMCGTAQRSRDCGGKRPIISGVVVYHGGTRRTAHGARRPFSFFFAAVFYGVWGLAAAGWRLAACVWRVVNGV